MRGVLGEGRESYMKKILARLKSYDSLFLANLILLGLWQVLRCPDLPGLYLDAVNPDYLAVQILFPQVNNLNWAVPYSGVPLLGQLYHGTFTIWLQLLVIGLCGKANMLTLRLTNMIYVIGICWVMHLILKKLKINKCVSFMMIDALILSPNVFSFVRTQYYIKLPGTLLLMLAIYFALLSGERNRHAFYLALSGILLGGAFYSYFIFLFFAPALLTICLVKTKKLCLKCLKDAFIWCMGFASGSVLYVIGYTDFIITSTGLEPYVKRTLVVVGGILLLAMVITLAYILVKKYQNDKMFHRCCLVVLCLFLLSGAAIIINLNYIIRSFTPMFNSLEIAGTAMGFTQRLKQIFFFWSGVMSNRFLESLMIDTTSSFMPLVPVFLLIVALSIVFFLTITKKLRRNAWKNIFIFGGLLLSYSLFCIPFASRMGGQHFTPVFFITWLMIILLLDCIWNSIINSNIKRVCLSLLVGTFFLWCAINSNLLQQNLEFSGGKNMYTDAINTLADNALSEKMGGTKNVYVFPEWGFMCGFDYLTMNQIPYKTDIDLNMLEEYINNGYGFKICTWDRENIEQYVELLNQTGIQNLSIETMPTREGETAFYILTGNIH